MQFYDSFGRQLENRLETQVISRSNNLEHVFKRLTSAAKLAAEAIDRGILCLIEVHEGKIGVYARCRVGDEILQIRRYVTFLDLELGTFDRLDAEVRQVLLSLEKAWDARAKAGATMAKLPIDAAYKESDLTRLPRISDIFIVNGKELVLTKDNLIDALDGVCIAIKGELIAPQSEEHDHSPPQV